MGWPSGRLESEGASDAEIALGPARAEPSLVEGGGAAFEGFGGGCAPADVAQAGLVAFGQLEAVVVGVFVAAQVHRALVACGFAHAEQLGEEPQAAFEVGGVELGVGHMGQLEAGTGCVWGGHAVAFPGVAVRARWL